MSILSSALARVGISKDTQRGLLKAGVAAAGVATLGPLGGALGGLVGKAGQALDKAGVTDSVKDFASQELDRIRSFGADTVAKVGAGGSMQLAGRIAPDGNGYQAAASVLNDKSKRQWLIYGGLAAALLLVVFLLTRHRSP